MGSTIRALLDSTRRVNALSETCKRYGVIVRNLTEAIGEAAPECDGETALLLERALADAEAAVAATDDALGRALEDLPEGASADG